MPRQPGDTRYSKTLPGPPKLIPTSPPAVPSAGGHAHLRIHLLNSLPGWFSRSPSLPPGLCSDTSLERLLWPSPVQPPSLPDRAPCPGSGQPLVWLQSVALSGWVKDPHHTASLGPWPSDLPLSLGQHCLELLLPHMDASILLGVTRVISRQTWLVTCSACLRCAHIWC